MLTVCPSMASDHQEAQQQEEEEEVVCLCCSQYIYRGQTHGAFWPQELDHTLPNQSNTLTSDQISAPSYLEGKKVAAGCLVSQLFRRKLN